MMMKAATGSPDTRYCVIFEDTILMEQHPDGLRFPSMLMPAILEQVIYQRSLGFQKQTEWIAMEIKQGQPQQRAEFIDLRSLYNLVEESIWIAAGRALQVIRWNRDHQFCSRCGKAVIERHYELAKECERCGLVSYPRISPAVIMSIVDGDRILLARAPHFPAGMYSALAGFVEPGETMEQAVQREIMEEVNLQVDEIKYLGSQPWPFPHSMMVAYTTRFIGGQLQVNKTELEDAQWFTRSKLPKRLPTRVSISRRLIDDFINS